MAFAIKKLGTAFPQSPGKPQKRAREKADGHLRFIRRLPCLVTGRRDVEAAHVRFGDIARYFKYETGAGEKPHDKWAVPLSVAEHRRQHSMNERDYWTLVDIDPLHIATLLWFHTGDEEACEHIIRNARRSNGD